MQAFSAAHPGIELQLRAIALPQVSAAGAFNAEQSRLIESFPLPAPFDNYIHFPDQNWNADVKVQQSIYAGGRILSAIRSANPSLSLAPPLYSA